MKIKKYICPLVLGFISFQAYAAPSTNQQVEKIIEIEHWSQLKSALITNGLPNLKSITEDTLITELEIPRPISAQHQVSLTKITDILINDMIEQIDEKKINRNIKNAYKELSQEQAAALIELYQQPSMKNIGKKIPISFAYSIDSSTNDFIELIQSEIIQNTIREIQ